MCIVRTCDIVPGMYHVSTFGIIFGVHADVTLAFKLVDCVFVYCSLKRLT